MYMQGECKVEHTLCTSIASGEFAFVFIQMGLQHSTTSAAQHSLAHHGTAQHNLAQHSTCAMPRLCHACNAVLYSACWMSCYAVPCLPCCAVLCCACHRAGSKTRCSTPSACWMPAARGSCWHQLALAASHQQSFLALLSVHLAPPLSAERTHHFRLL